MSTTDESLAKRLAEWSEMSGRYVDTRRKSVATKAGEPNVSAVVLADAVNDLAEAEGETHAYRSAAYAMRAGGRDGLQRAILKLAVQNPDDTRSGRRNDARRAYNDGVRAALEAVVNELVYGRG